MSRMSRFRLHIMMMWLENARDDELEKLAAAILSRPKEARHKTEMKVSKLSRLLHRR